MEVIFENIVPIAALLALAALGMVLEILFRKKEKRFVSAIFAGLSILASAALFVFLLAIDAEAAVILPVLLLAMLIALIL